MTTEPAGVPSRLRVRRPGAGAAPAFHRSAEESLVVVPLRAGTMQEQRTAEANLITVLLAAVCGLGCIAGMVPAVDHAIGVLVGAAAGAAIAVVLLRWVARRVRWHLEDREDERIAALWRARATTGSGDRESRGERMRIA
jgi:hypothetical protein